MNTQQHYGKIMAEGLFKTSEGLKSTLLAMNEFKVKYNEELNEKLKVIESEEERAKIRTELEQLNKPEVRSSELMIGQIDSAMQRLNEALQKVFKIS